MRQLYYKSIRVIADKINCKSSGKSACSSTFNRLLVIIAICLSIVSSEQAFAQLNPKQQQRLESEKIAFFTQKLNLTPAEAEKFWPLYNDYSNRKQRIQDEVRSIGKYILNNGTNLTDAEANELTAKYIKLQNDETNLLNEYFKKFNEILPPQKLATLYVAEEQFKIHLLKKIQKMKDKQQNNNKAKDEDNGL